MYQVPTGQYTHRGSGSQSVVFRATEWFARNANSQASLRHTESEPLWAGPSTLDFNKPFKWFSDVPSYLWATELGPFKIIRITCSSFNWTV